MRRFVSLFILERIKQEKKQNKRLTNSSSSIYWSCRLNALGVIHSGGLAQLGERMAGSHEVRGSIPLGSTNINLRL